MPSPPLTTEFAPYYAGYLALITEPDILAMLEAQIDDLERMIQAVPPERETYRYAPGKWSIREVVGHLIDADRVFGYRAFCISRGEKAALPSYDENEYVAKSGYHDRTLQDLLAEFTQVRQSNLAFFLRLTDDQWMQMGIANHNPVSVRAIAFITAGHLRHHLNVLQKSYVLSPIE